MDSIDQDQMDKFTFLPGQLEPVTDPDLIAEIDRKCGGPISLDEEEQAWISSEGKKRWSVGDYVATDELQAEYARRKDSGTKRKPAD